LHRKQIEDPTKESSDESEDDENIKPLPNRYSSSKKKKISD